jgi:hypothetical protein
LVAGRRHELEVVLTVLLAGAEVADPRRFATARRDRRSGPGSAGLARLVSDDGRRWRIDSRPPARSRRRHRPGGGLVAVGLTSTSGGARVRSSDGSSAGGTARELAAHNGEDPMMDVTAVRGGSWPSATTSASSTDRDELISTDVSRAAGGRHPALGQGEMLQSPVAG